MSPIEYDNGTVEEIVKSGRYKKRFKNRNTVAMCKDCNFKSDDFFPTVIEEVKAHESKTSHTISVRMSACGFGLL